jgi:15-hydroxyprostaglandin dehydrogenase (NAD)
VGLVRSVGPVLAKEKIRVNCVCPAFVPTNLAPESMLKAMPKEHLTPVSTIVRAFYNFELDPSLVGMVAECSLENIYYREQVPYCDESERFIQEGSSKIWEEGYKL